MDKWLILAAAAMASVVGFIWLALAMQDHWQQVQGEAGPAPATRAMLRVLGAAGLAAAGLLCFTADRPSMAVLNWMMLMTLGAVTVAFTLAWKPALLRLAWPGARSRHK